MGDGAKRTRTGRAVAFAARVRGGHDSPRKRAPVGAARRDLAGGMRSVCFGHEHRQLANLGVMVRAVELGEAGLAEVDLVLGRVAVEEPEEIERQLAGRR